MLPRHSGVWVVCYKERVEILRDVSMCQVGKNKLMNPYKTDHHSLNIIYN